MNLPEDRAITFMQLEQGSNQAQGLKAHLAGVEQVEAGSLDKIRDILFGNQMREYEKRFSRLEERLVKDQADLREDINKRLDNMESYVKQEIDALTGRVNKEPIARDEAVKRLSQDLKNLIESVERKIIELEQQNNQSQRELRQQILEQSKNIDNEIRQNNEAILASLEQEAKKLRTDKTDRSTLATLFAELAVRLSNS
jgi:DNA repair exonuclease SbcCD ATPase subunit